VRLTDEKIADVKEYLNRSIKVTVSSLIPQLSKYGIDLIDTIEALQQENEQLQAQVARMWEALRKARNLLQRYKDHIKSYPCECKFGLDFYGNKTPFRDGEMCERCAELAEIDKAIGGKEDV